MSHHLTRRDTLKTLAALPAALAADTFLAAAPATQPARKIRIAIIRLVRVKQ